MKPLYVISSACISPQLTFGQQPFILHNSCISTEQPIMYCVEPDFKQFINPVQIRRMSRALKIGFSAAIDCLNNSPLKNMDAIIIGTGKGCLIDTEAFLHSIRKYHETALNPTHFIHSTYNQLNGMIALDQKINSYNVTYAHRGFSFEHTIVDASLLVDEGEAANVLIGSFDEMTQEHFLVKKTWGYWKEELIDTRHLLISDSEGTIAGEGSSFFVLSGQQTEKQQVSIVAIQTLYNPSESELRLNIQNLLIESNISGEQVDLLMLGNNGNNKQQKHTALFADIFSEATSLFFKHLCGEYDTASQFGFWLITQILTHQIIPESLYLPTDTKRFSKERIRYVLLYNNYFEFNQSLILLKM